VPHLQAFVNPLSLPLNSECVDMSTKSNSEARLCRNHFSVECDENNELIFILFQKKTHALAKN